MDSLTIGPITRVDGTVDVPGSKSASNRILLLSAFASGTTRMRNLLDSDDTGTMVEALLAMGVGVQLTPDRTSGAVTGLGGPLPATQADLFLGNAGTAVRPLTAAVCLGNGTFTITGDDQMHERPIADLVDALRQLGVAIDYLGNDGCPPLRIRTSGVVGGACTVRGDTSSQYLTALLMLLPMVDHPVRIDVLGDLVSRPYIDLTLSVMAQFGVDVEHDGYASFTLANPAGYTSPGDVLVEGDASSATYFLSAAAIRGGTVRINGVGRGSTQGDAQYAEVLGRMGAKVVMGPDFIEVTRGELKGIDFDGGQMPDAAMSLATTALFAEGTTLIRNIHTWRFKETDRLAAMTTELRKVGATVTATDSTLEIVPPARVQAAAIDTYNDHRMAMCFSLAALGDAAITINDPDCVSKTFPEYFDEFARITY
jgi:3-phosphoshikimate 1-carboxyvinyltransferase